MHRQILGLKPGDKLQGEHRNLDTLDNRDENLRIATHSQNQFNRSKQANNSSGYKGVVRRKRGWQASIQVQGKRITLGTRQTPEEAFELYKIGAAKYHGDFFRVE